MAEDNTQQSITICSPQSYRIEFNDRIEYAKQHTTLYSPEQIESMVPDFILRIEQEVQNENHHHVCESIDLGQEYDENGKMKHQNLKQVKVKFMRKSKCPHVISFFVDEVEGKKTATLQHILHGLQIQHRVAKESTRHWILLREFVNRITMRNNTMKKLNITKERFEKSRYFQKKYGTLEYVSESGKVFKTSKGNLIRFNEASKDDRLSRIRSRASANKNRDDSIRNSKIESIMNDMESIRKYRSELKDCQEAIKELNNFRHDDPINGSKDCLMGLLANNYKCFGFMDSSTKTDWINCVGYYIVSGAHLWYDFVNDKFNGLSDEDFIKKISNDFWDRDELLHKMITDVKKYLDVFDERLDNVLERS